MIDISLSSPKLFCALFDEQLKLEAFGVLPITESTQARDKYLQDALDWVKSQAIDPAYGGIYRSDNERLHYNGVCNAIISCWLLSAGRALYSGELTQYGLKMLDAVFQDFWNETEEVFLEEMVFTIGEAPLVYENLALENLLTDDELALLKGYIGRELVDGDNECAFRNQMSLAAKSAGMHVKQAQVVDFSLREKLKELSNTKGTRNSKGKLCADEQALLFSCLTQASLWHSREVQMPHYSILLNKIKKRLSNKLYRSQSQLIFDLYSGIELNQLYFDSEFVDKICQLTNDFEWRKVWRDLSALEKIMAVRTLSACANLATQPNQQCTFKQHLRSKEMQELMPYFYQALNKNRERFLERYRVTEYLVPFAS